MSEKPLLLPSAKTPIVLAQPQKLHPASRAVFVVLGTLVVLYGAADLLGRVAIRGSGTADQTIFVPHSVAVPGTGEAPVADVAVPIVPARLFIASIGVNASVESVGKDAKGAMKTPSSFTTVAWYSLGSSPGEAGNAVIDGHVNNALTKAGVFEHLSDIAMGATIQVADAAGHTLSYRVRDIEDYSTEDAPTDVIFSRTGPSQLVLITCAGDWDAKAHSFNKRLVVFASLVPQQ